MHDHEGTITVEGFKSTFYFVPLSNFLSSELVFKIPNFGSELGLNTFIFDRRGLSSFARP